MAKTCNCPQVENDNKANCYTTKRIIQCSCGCGLSVNLHGAKPIIIPKSHVIDLEDMTIKLRR